MKWVMFPHSGSINHGCEALARAVSFLVKKADPSAVVDIYTNSIESDIKYGLNSIGHLFPIENKDIELSSLKGFFLRAKSKIFKDDLDSMLLGYKHQIYRNSDIALSIGGDNYCYSGMQHVLSEHTKAISFWGKPSILLGCSLDRELLSPKVINELNCYQTIIARETITLNTLHDIGLGEKSHLASDPAFILPTEYTEWPDKKLVGKKVIGINISPLINRYKGSDMIMLNYYNLVKYILQEPDVYVALISHVEQLNNDDHETSVKLSELVDSERVSVIPNGYNCMQLKSLISQCDSFIGARTHATIAAYSSKIPTLVVGYSTKSKGIARDIFGSENGMVIPVQEFKTEITLVDTYKLFVERKPEIKTILNETIEDYSKKAFLASNVLSQYNLK